MPHPVMVDLVGWPIYIGIIIAMIAWAWWRSERSIAETASKPPNAPAPALQPSPTAAPPSPISVGRWFVLSLVEHCKIENISKDEKDITAAIGLPLERYYKAILGLAALSIDYSIIALLHGKPSQNDVRSGFAAGIRELFEEDADKAAVIQTGLKKYGQEYKIAADRFYSQEAGVIGNPLNDTFHRIVLTDFLKSQPTAIMALDTTTLAQIAIERYFFGYQSIAEAVFIEAGLAVAPA